MLAGHHAEDGLADRSHPIVVRLGGTGEALDRRLAMTEAVW